MAETKEKQAKKTIKEQKRQLRLAKKEEKLARRMARQEEKLARKRAREEAKRHRRAARRALEANVVQRSVLNREQTIQLLEDVVAGLKAGAVELEHQEEKVTVQPQDTIRVSYRCRQKADNEGIRISLRWPRGHAEEKVAATESPTPPASEE